MFKKSKEEEFEAIFIGGCSVSHCVCKRDENGVLWGRSLKWGFFKIWKPLFYANELIESTYTESSEYDVSNETLQTKKLRIYFVGLARKQELIFGKNMPTEVLVRFQVLKTQRDVYRNRYSDLLRLVGTSSSEDLRKEMLAREVSLSKKLSGGQPNYQQMQQK